MPTPDHGHAPSQFQDAGQRNIAPYLCIIRPENKHILLGQISMMVWLNIIETMFQRAAILHQHGKLFEAECAYETILAYAPAHPHALHLSGVLQSQNGNHGKALGRLKRALAFMPDDPGLISNLALALKGMGRFKEAVRHFERALALKPAFAPARIGLHRLCIALANKAQEGHRRDEALSWYRRALKLVPNHALCLNNTAVLCQEMGRIDEALHTYRKALAASANTSFIHSNYLLGLHYSPNTTQREYYLKAKIYGADKQPDAIPFSRLPGNRRPIRLGYISGDFSGHAVSTFILPLLEMHDPAQARTVLFSNTPLQKTIVRWLETVDLSVREIHNLDDKKALALLRDEKLDLLVDLSGHTACNRLPVLARRAAPVQATWLGYFNTTGVAAMDYLLADSRCCPKGSEKWYTEKIFRLPASFFCYTPPEVTMPENKTPCLAGNPFTFGCFNETAKLNRDVVQTWAEILRQAPDSRLMLKAKGFADKGVVKRYQSLFEYFGISPERLILEGPENIQSYLAAHGRVDLCLDPFPYNGGTVTCDALWTGTPVLNLAGKLMVGRMGLSILHAAGLAEWACHSREEYIRRAVHLAVHPEELARMRHGVRAKMLASPLCDQITFVNDLMRAYRTMTGLG